MVYVQFYVKKQWLCGSDGIFILDGRNNLSTMIIDCKERIYKLRFVQPSIDGFEILKGRIGQGNQIYKHNID